MNILITGNRGRIGTYLQQFLISKHMNVLGYDIRDGKDILNTIELEQAVRRNDFIIHLAIYSGASVEDPVKLMEVNLQGTWNILFLAAKYRLKRIIYMSSVDALGIFKGEGKPAYLPVDNEHPCQPGTPYGISKKLAEEMCRLWSDSAGIPVVCLRPPGVWFKETYRNIINARRADPEYEWKPYWEYGAFIDIRDLALLIEKILKKKKPGGYQCYLISSPDITTSGLTSFELSRKIHPDVPFTGGREYEENPYKTLLDIEPVRKAFGWTPQFTWKRFLENISY